MGVARLGASEDPISSLVFAEAASTVSELLGGESRELPGPPKVPNKIAQHPKAPK